MYYWKFFPIVNIQHPHSLCSWFSLLLCWGSYDFCKILNLIWHLSSWLVWYWAEWSCREDHVLSIAMSPKWRICTCKSHWHIIFLKRVNVHSLFVNGFHYENWKWEKKKKKNWRRSMSITKPSCRSMEIYGWTWAQVVVTAYPWKRNIHGYVCG